MQLIRGCRLIGWVAVILASASASELMPVTQQNKLVHKYCAVCHTDAANNGGLSLEHFDAAQAAPSLIAMLLSKLSGGVALDTVRAVNTNPKAAALVDNKMKSGAMGAAGIRIPDKATVDSLIHTFAEESHGASEWSIEGSRASRLTASLLQEVPTTKDFTEARMYRLIVSCNGQAKEGFMQLAWSPIPRDGTISASSDGKAPVSIAVQGSEKMGNGTRVVTSGLAALMLSATGQGSSRTDLPFPAESLKISDLFPGETVVFSFARLPAGTRHELEECFPKRELTALRAHFRH